MDVRGGEGRDGCEERRGDGMDVRGGEGRDGVRGGCEGGEGEGGEMWEGKVTMYCTTL